VRGVKSVKELDAASEEFRRTFNFLLGMLRMKGLSRKVALGFAFMALIGWRASVRNAALTFGLNYANLLDALGRLEDAWGKYVDALKGVVERPVVVIVDDTFDHNLYSRVEGVASRYGNYFVCCSSHSRFEPGVQVTHGCPVRLGHWEELLGRSVPLRYKEDVGDQDGERVQD